MLSFIPHKRMGGISSRVFTKFGPEATDDGQVPESDEGQEPPKAVEGKEKGQVPKTFEEEYVKSLRSENASLRVKLKEVEDATLTEAQKLKKEHDDALAELQTLREKQRLSAIEAAAKKEGAKYEDLVAMKVPADTKPEDYVTVVKAIRKDYPELFKYQDGDGGKKGDKPDKDTTPGIGTLREAYAATAKGE